MLKLYYLHARRTQEVLKNSCLSVSTITMMNEKKKKRKNEARFQFFSRKKIRRLDKRKMKVLIDMFNKCQSHYLIQIQYLNRQ